VINTTRSRSYVVSCHGFSYHEVNSVTAYFSSDSRKHSLLAERLCGYVENKKGTPILMRSLVDRYQSRVCFFSGDDFKVSIMAH
jgi:hypothetical protein